VFVISYAGESNIEYGPVTGSCEHGSGPSGSVKGGTILDSTEAAEGSPVDGRDDGAGIFYLFAYYYVYSPSLASDLCQPAIK
jgi:hypothetical protein